MNNSFKRSLYVLCFLLLSISAKSVMATCELPPASQYECKGRTLVTNDEELAAYLENYKYNSRHNIVRGVRLSGNFSGESLDVKTPCGIVVLAGTTFDYTGDICLAGRELVVGQANVNIQNAANVELISLNRVVIRENFSANMTGDLSLLSLGSSMDSRSHIRYEANVSANNLILKSLRRSTIGHTSTFNLTGKLSILSNGEDLPTDEAEGISEWSSIWRDTTVNASEIEVISEDQARVANGVNLTANKVTLDGLTCKMGGTSSVTAAQKEGVCFDGSLPTIKLRRAAQYKEVLVGEDVFLDGSRSLYPEGSSFEWRIRRNKEDLTAWETGELTRTFNFDQAGDYRIFFKITKPDGHYNFAVRRVWVSDHAPSIFPYFKFYLKDSELQLVYEGRTFDGSMITNAYYSTPQGETLDVGRMVLGHVDVIPFESNESLELTLNLENENGETASFTHTIEPNAANQEPYLPIDFLEYAPLETLFFSNFFFDPYDQLGDLAGFALNFGDGESVELEQESFRQTHSYPSAGDYDLSLEVFNVEGESFSKAETITIAGVKDGLSSALPIVDFKIDKASWAPGVRLYIDESISPVSPITSYYWNLGDGQTAYGTEVLHFYDQGAYDVSLTVVTEDGNSNTITREVIVLNDAAMLYGSIDCWNIAPLQIECEVEGLSRDANLSEFLIHFGDSELTEENAEVESISGQLADGRFTHTFDSEGDYTVTFGVFTNDGEESLSTFDLTVSETFGNELPYAALDCFPAGNLQADCQATYSNDPDGYIVNYHYDFGDGQSADSSNNQIYHTYATAGQYTVTLTVMDNLGAVSSTQSVVNVSEVANQFPVASLECNSSAIQELTCNSQYSYDPDGSIIGARITFLEDGEFFESADYQNFVVIKNFTTAGLKQVKLEVEDNSGAISEYIGSFNTQENAQPVVSFNCNSNAIGSLRCSASNSYDNDGSIIEYKWLIDGSEYLGEEILVSGITSSEMDVSLFLTDDFGSIVSASYVYSVKQNEVPYGDFTCESNLRFKLICTSELVDSDGSINSVEWEIDNNIYYGDSLEVMLESGGSKLVTLKAVDNDGAIFELSKEVSVFSNQDPVAVIVSDSSSKIVPSVFHLSGASSIDPEGDILSYNWHLPDGSILNGANIEYPLNMTSKESIRLVVTDDYGGTSEDEIILTGIESLENEIILSQSSVFAPSVLNISARNLVNSFGEPYTFEWYINSIFVSQGSSYEYMTQDAQEYEITLKVTDIYGNSESISKNINVEVPLPYFELSKDKVRSFTERDNIVELINLNTDNESDIIITYLNENNDLVIDDSTEGSVTLSALVETRGTLSIIISNSNNTYIRDIQYEFIDIANQQVLNVGESGSNLTLNNVYYAKLESDNPVEVIVDSGTFEDGSVYFEFSVQNEDDIESMKIHEIDESFDATIINPNVFASSKNDIKNSDINISALGLTEISHCLNTKSILAASIVKPIGLLFSATLGRNLDFYSTNYFGQSIVVDSLVRDSFFRTSCSDGQVYCLKETSRLFKSIDNLVNKMNFSTAPLTILKDSTFRGIVAFSPYENPGFVIPGVNRVFIPESTINLHTNTKGTRYNIYETLAHEASHVNDGKDCKLQHDLNKILLTSGKIISESYADMSALNFLIDKQSVVLNEDGTSLGDSLITSFRPLRESLSFENFNDFLFSYMVDGANDNNYDNELYFDIEGGNLKSFTNLLDGVNFFETFSFANTFNNATQGFPLKAHSYLKNSVIKNGKFDILGFKVEESALELSEGEYEIGPLGFGFLKIKREDIINGSFSSKFILHVKHSSDVTLEHIDENGLFASQISKELIAEDEYAYTFWINDALNDDGYLTIVNSSVESVDLEVKRLGEICYVNESMYAADEFVFVAPTNTCEYCPHKAIKADGSCDWPAPDLSVTQTSYDVNVPDECDGLGIGHHSLGSNICHFNSICDGGTFDNQTYTGSFTLPGVNYVCATNDNGDWVVTPTTEGSSIEVKCINPEGEEASKEVHCE